MILVTFCNLSWTISEIIVQYGLVLQCFIPFSTIFQLYCGGQLLVEETGAPAVNH